RVALRGESRGDAGNDTEHLLRGKALADAEMARLLPRLGILEQTAVRHVVARAQKAARLREGMRAWVTRVLGLLREAMLDADWRLLRLVTDLEADARGVATSPVGPVPIVFFFTVDEAQQALRTSPLVLVPLVR